MFWCWLFVNFCPHFVKLVVISLNKKSYVQYIVIYKCNCNFYFSGNSTQAESLLQILKEDFFEPLKDITDLLGAVSSQVGGHATAASAGAAASNGSNGTNIAVPLPEEEPLKPLEPKCLTW